MKITKEKEMRYATSFVFNDGETNWRICDVTVDDNFIMYHCVDNDVHGIQKSFTGEAIKSYIDEVQD